MPNKPRSRPDPVPRFAAVFRQLSPEALERLRQYVESGKPLLCGEKGYDTFSEKGLGCPAAVAAGGDLSQLVTTAQTPPAEWAAMAHWFVRAFWPGKTLLEYTDQLRRVTSDQLHQAVQLACKEETP